MTENYKDDMEKTNNRRRQRKIRQEGLKAGADG